MKDKLKIKIWNYKNVVLYEVLEQSDNLRGKGLLFTASNGFEIYSCDYVDLDTETIFIRGNEKGKDKDVYGIQLDSIEIAEKLVKAIEQAVKEFNESFNQILTDKEREYLKAVIEPFRDKIVCITKFQPILNTKKHYIGIGLKDDEISFPCFEKDTMYKNMELGKSYTLEELGL